MGGKGSGGARAQKKKAMTLLMEAAFSDDYNAHKNILRVWFGVLGDDQHPQWLGALREYNRYILGIPVQQHELEVTSQLSTVITPEMLLAAGIKTVQVEVEDGDGSTSSRTIIAGVEDGPAGG